MKKIPSLFARDEQGNLTRNYHPLADWVVKGEGTATRKYDGTAVRVYHGKIWARYDAKRGKIPPAGFDPCQDPDLITGHWPGWIPADGPEHRWIREAFSLGHPWLDGTYEAVGPKINSNRERLTIHTLVRHGMTVLRDVPVQYDELVEYFTERNRSGTDIEGVVWWRDVTDQDCDKIKITCAALGVPRPR